MKEQFVTFYTAQKLKELGFKEPSNHFYTLEGKLMARNLTSGDEPMDFEPEDFYENFNSGVMYNVGSKGQYVITAPTWYQVIWWLRENHKIKVIENVDFGWDVYKWHAKDNCYYLCENGQVATLETAINKSLREITWKNSN